VKVKLYVRAAKSNKWRRGYKVAVDMAYDGAPLETADGTPIYTAQFALTLEIPEEMLKPGALPEVTAAVTSDGAAAVLPMFSQTQLIEALKAHGEDALKEGLRALGEDD
jgi:hypothetical protein